MRTKENTLTLPALLFLIVLLLLAWYLERDQQTEQDDAATSVTTSAEEPFVTVNGNVPLFSQEEWTTDSYEFYSPLDSLGRCGYAMACIGYDMMPTEERENISQVIPSGWEQSRYSFIDGGSLYNRCHLIGFQLTGENANECNLFTGTRYCNVEGMLPFENLVANYVRKTRNHVLYRVTPVFEGDELLARGIRLEAMSMEDKGKGICFHVYVYNRQSGVIIDYMTGENWLESSWGHTYIVNLTSLKFHSEACPQGQSIKEENKEVITADRQILIDRGYISAGCCKP